MSLAGAWGPWSKLRSVAHRIGDTDSVVLEQSKKIRAEADARWRAVGSENVAPRDGMAGAA